MTPSSLRDPSGQPAPRAGWLDTASALWGGTSWEQDLSRGHWETLVRPGCLRSAAPYLTKNQGRRKAALVASKRTSSPGLLCSHREPLLSGGSQRCSANGCHLPAGHAPANGTSQLGLPGDKDRKGAVWFALSPFPECRERDLPPPNQLRDVDITYKLQTWVRTAVGSGQDILQCPRR